MVTVRFPSTMQERPAESITIADPVATIEDLITVLNHRIPGFREQLDDSVFNFAVNDEMLLYKAREHALRDGDVVEIIPTISGGCQSR